MEIVTRLAGVHDVERAAAVLGEAFADYPWTRWTVDPTDHQQRIVALQRLSLEHHGLPFGSVSVTTVDGQIHSVALWTDSAAVAAGAVEHSVAARAAALESSRHDASGAADRQVRHLRPNDRHLYLGTIGTSRAMQGRGLATRTLGPLLLAADGDGLEIWLETSTDRNVGFYRRLGFDVVNRIDIEAGGPPVWIMSRQPLASTP